MAKHLSQQKMVSRRRDKEKRSTKRVVYLWGAGATHSEAQYLGAAVNLLMRDSEKSGEGVTTRILRRTAAKSAAFLEGDPVDIEKLISLMASSGLNRHVEDAERLRSDYFNELRDSLATARLLPGVRLGKMLLEMHQNDSFRQSVETLSGIITTNHDGLLQIAFQEVYGGVNLGFPYVSEAFTAALSAADIPPLAQLHGSFTWMFGVPIKVSPLQSASKYRKDTVWIPPTILKEPRSYPFNKLSALGYELLSKHCDVLRVVGASLTQNDWNILSMIFNAQRHIEVTGGTEFSIELVMPHTAGELIKRDCGYLKRLTSIGYLTEGEFGEYKEDVAPTTDMENPFAYWLFEKLKFHEGRGELPSGFTESTALDARGQST